MALVLAEAVVTVAADAKDVTKQIAKDIDGGGPALGKSGKGLGGALLGGFTGVLAGGAAIAAIGWLSGAVDSASDLNEVVSKSRAIFGDQAADLEKWAGRAALNVGLTKGAALTAAAGFGDMFTQIGFTGQAAAEMSKGVVQASADLGSFSNLETADVADRMSAAFRGEYDSLQAVIPNINAARVESEALAATGKTVASELTAQEKATAVLAIVQKDGARAMGDFAKTSDGFANSQKIATASIGDMQTTIGTALLPVVNQLMGSFIDVLPALTAFGTWVAGSTGWLIPLIAALGLAAAAVWVVNFAIAANPIGLWIAAGILFIGIVVAIVANWSTIWPIIISAFETAAVWLLGVFKGFAAWWNAGWAGVGAFVTGIWTGFIAFIVAGWNGFVSWLAAGLAGVAAFWNAGWAGVSAFVTAIWTGLIGFITGAWSGFSGWIMAALGAFAGWWNGLWAAVGSGITTIWTGFIGVVSRLWSGYVSAFMGIGNGILGWWNGLWGSVGATISGAWSNIVSAASAGASGVASLVRELPGRIMGALGNLGGLLLGSGRALIQGFIDGIKGMLGNVGKAVGGIMDYVSGFFPNSPADHGPLSGTGWTRIKRAGHAVVDEFDDGLSEAESPTGRLGRTIAGVVNLTAAPINGVNAQRRDGNQSTAPAGDTYMIENVTIDAKNVREFTDIVELIKSLPQVARAGRGNGKVA